MGVSVSYFPFGICGVVVVVIFMRVLIFFITLYKTVCKTRVRFCTRKSSFFSGNYFKMLALSSTFHPKGVLHMTFSLLYKIGWVGCVKECWVRKERVVTRVKRNIVSLVLFQVNKGFPAWALFVRSASVLVWGECAG